MIDQEYLDWKGKRKDDSEANLEQSNLDNVIESQITLSRVHSAKVHVIQKLIHV